ncbi:hypothetical protein H012_gp893 [Acanthamoeba polyphaga moumouvirus]|uniref:Uncharacterized protein n=2 Tax=Moumouvirus TaxID=3080801 RepID=L7RCA0_9VIRU|nr:hypothetical protein H012_gp893 [Acanthamoeba polyphaga moumouvirus]AEX63302.1 hypothetical protein mv_R1100 [Moumouvirus Monve]AGC01573.1 hypothetical protein Moumou_00025 [Acanthamoeba polyphaga moumouvirus]
MKYINENILDLGTTESEIYRNLRTIFHYICHQIHLNGAKMSSLYKHIEVDYISDSIFTPNNIQDGKYYYIITKFNESYFLDPDSDYDFNTELLKELGKYFEEKSAKNLIIKNIHGLTLINNNGINNDIGGISDLDWKLYFWDKFVVQKNRELTFHNLIIAAFKIKSHKFDFWYELFIDLKEENLLICHHSNSKNRWIEITAVVEFDHGS